jgi:hypothetical protein
MKLKREKLREIKLLLSNASILGPDVCVITLQVRIKSIRNDGIGAYEYYGKPCYDNGIDFVEDFEIKSILVDGVIPAVSLYKRIENYLYDKNNEEWSYIADTLLGKINVDYMYAMYAMYDKYCSDNTKKDDICS